MGKLRSRSPLIASSINPSPPRATITSHSSLENDPYLVSISDLYAIASFEDEVTK
jgi:hypothetical protein